MIIQPEVSSEARAAYRRSYTLPRGGEVLIWEAARDDADRLRAMFARCSADTIHSRFHLPYATVPEPLIELLIGPTGRNGRAFVAVNGDEVVGHAMYTREDDDRTAEVAVVVEDEWQRSGLGRLLLSVTAGEAQRAGVETLTVRLGVPTLGTSVSGTGVATIRITEDDAAAQRWDQSKAGRGRA